jgi:integrase
MLPENVSNPWARMSRTVKDSTRGATSKRRPWTDAELLKLTQGVPEGDPLLPMIVIAAYAGLRREEVALLRTEDVHSDALVVREGKSEAAVRRVPLHPVLRPFVARLKEQATDAYLIPGLLTGGADARRGHAIGKRFATFKASLGFKDESLNFHTLRNSFAQRMENAEVPVSTTKLVIGHKREDITYGTYSPGPMFKVLQDAVAKVTFGALDAHVSGLAGSVQVTRKMRRRYRREPN